MAHRRHRRATPRHFFRFLGACGWLAPLPRMLESLESRVLLSAISWTGNAGDNLWTSSTNWSGNALPGAGDDVTISVAGNPTIQIPSGNQSIHSLVSDNVINFSGGTLAVQTTTSMSANFLFSGGYLFGGTLTFSGNAEAVSNLQGATWNGVTLVGSLLISNTVGNASQFSVINGLTLDGDITLARNGFLFFDGASQTLGGNGSVFFTNDPDQGLITRGAGMALTVGSGITIHGGNATAGFLAASIGTSVSGGGSFTASIVNFGTIDADGAPGTLMMVNGAIVNHGTLESDGGALFVNNVSGNAGSLALTAAGSAITLGGSGYALDQPVTLATSATLTLSGTLGLASLSNITATGAVVNLTGTLTGTGTSATLNGGTLQLLGGTILGGTLTLGNNAILASSSTGTNTLSGMTINGNVYLSAPPDSFSGASLRVNSGLTLNGTLTIGAYSSLYFDGSQTLDGQGTVYFTPNGFEGISLNGSGMTFTIGSNMTIRGSGISGFGPPGSSIGFNGANISIINKGTIILDNPGTILFMEFSGTFINQGIVEAVNNTYLEINNPTGNTPFSISGSASLLIASGSTLFIADDLTGATTESNLFKLSGTTNFGRTSSSAAAPQLLEAMSQDLGATSSAFSNNFAFGIITLSNNSYVKLVDQYDNSTGTSSEAVYVNSLIVPTGATLDLNGLHVYARDVQISGTVTGGSVTQLADTASLNLGSPVEGAISDPGELDAWTFTEQAGHVLNISLDPGSGGPNGPDAPTLQSGEVQLVAPSGAILATADSATAGSLLSLQNVSLPSTGTYTIRVRGASPSVGNYVLSASDVTPPTSSVDTLPTFEPGSFSVDWSGTDNSGSGLASFDISVSDNGGTFTPWLTATADTEATYNGQDGHTYGFYSIAHDNDGNTQPTPSAAQATTTVDTTPPTSSISALPSVETGSSFTLSWSGVDNASGSGLDSFDILVSDNGGAFTPYLVDTTLTSASFTGVNLHTFAFYSVAHDDVGNTEDAPDTADATTLVNLAFGQPTKLAFNAQPTHVLAGATLPDSVVVDVEDSLGNLLATQSSSITLAIASGPSGGTLLGTLTTQAQNGEATFDGLSFSKAGTYILRATAGGAAAGQTTAITVSLPPTHLGFKVQPGSTIAGHVIGPAVTVQILDASDHVVTLDNSMVSISLLGSPGGSLSGTTSVQAVQGVATFSDLSLVDAGAYALGASDSALTSAKSKAFTITAETASAHLVLLTQPAAALGGKALTPSLTVAVEDQFGNVVLTDHSKVGLSVTTGPGALSGTVLVTASKGIAVFSKAVLSAAGDYSLSASDSGIATATPIALSQEVDAGVTTVAAPKPAASYVFGKVITLSTTFKATSPGSVRFTGTAGIYDSTHTLLGVGTLTAGGAFKVTLDNIPPATILAFISYGGDAAHTAATSSGFTLQINPSPTSMALTASATTLVFGQSLTLTAAVNSSSAPDVVRTGSVSFYDGLTLLGTVPLNGSSAASLTVDPGTVGKHSFKAFYTGDGNFVASSSSALARSVNKDRTSIVVAASALNPIAVNQTLNAAIHVAAIAPGASTLTGDSVMIKDNGKVLMTVALDSNGDAFLPGLTYSAAGSHTLVAIFGGDADALAVTSAGLKLTVT